MLVADVVVIESVSPQIPCSLAGISSTTYDCEIASIPLTPQRSVQGIFPVRLKSALRDLVALLTVLAHVLAAPIVASAQSETARAILDAAVKGDRQAQFSAGVIHEGGI